jgi:hypothetical protein
MSVIRNYRTRVVVLKATIVVPPPSTVPPATGTVSVYIAYYIHYMANNITCTDKRAQPRLYSVCFSVDLDRGDNDISSIHAYQLLPHLCCRRLSVYRTVPIEDSWN